MDVSLSLKRARIQRGLTASEVCDGVGISRARYYAMSRQKSIKTETLQKLADFFGLPVSEFIALGEKQNG